jgi:5-methylcytosine-specific restriction enzyme subunit McrC
MKDTLIITEHEEIKVSSNRDIEKKIISKEDKKLLFSIIHKDKDGKERYVFSRKGKYGIKANSMVGSISLKSGLIIEILPKFAKGDLSEKSIIRYRKTLLQMIKVSKEKNFLSSTTESSKIAKGEMPLIRYMIELFSQSLLDLLRNGIFMNYNNRVDNLSYIKGNILVSKTIQNNIVDKTKVYVSYNKHSSNNLLMQIFRTLAKLLLNDTNLSYRAKNNLYEVYTILDNVDIISLKKQHFSEIVFNRLNNKFEIIFKRAEFIFNQYMPFTSNQNSTPFWAILFNMDYLFEKFCAYLFRKSNIKFQAQNQIKSFSRNKYTLSIKPDFIIEKNLVVDSKWKLINNKNLYGLDAQNFWQLFSYMNLVSEKEINGYFIVPKNSNKFDDEMVFEHKKEGNKTITILSIDFSLAFEELIEKYRFKIVDDTLKLDLKKQRKELIKKEENFEDKKNNFSFKGFINELASLKKNGKLLKHLLKSSTIYHQLCNNIFLLKEIQVIEKEMFNKFIKWNLNISSLAMDNLNIGEIPKNINKLKKLKFLYLNNNNIIFLPNGLFQLKKLEILDISNNNIKIIPNKIQELEVLKELIIDKDIIINNIGILKKLKKQNIKIEDAKKHNLSEYINSFIEPETTKEVEKQTISKEIKPIEKNILNISIDDYLKMEKEEKISFVNDRDLSSISLTIIEFIMEEKDIDILEDFTYNFTLPLRFAFATYNNNLDRKEHEVKRLKENIFKRKNKKLKWLLDWSIKSQKTYIQNNIYDIDKEILLGYALSILPIFEEIREVISQLTISFEILDELSKNKDDKTVLEHIMLKNREHESLQNTNTIYSTLILDRIAHYNQYYNFEDKFCLIAQLAGNDSLTKETREYLFNKYKDDEVILEALYNDSLYYNHPKLQKKIENIL